MKSEPQKTRFTLIELLVVIAIIAIVSGMLLPSLTKAREKVRRVKCLGNLKDIGLALNSYSIDNFDWYPSANESTTALNLMVREQYITTATSYTCPSRQIAATIDLGPPAIITSCNYLYVDDHGDFRDSPGLAETFTQADTSLMSDRLNNHPSILGSGYTRYGNILYAGGYVKGFADSNWNNESSISLQLRELITAFPDP